MQLRPSRVALHLVGVAVLASGSVLLSGTPGHADDQPRPDSYGGDSTASSIHFFADRTPQPTPVTDTFHAELPYATTSLDSSGSATGLATALYPGGGLLGLPALMCQFAAQLCGPPFPAVPPYPLMATADYPTTPNAQAQADQGIRTLGPLRFEPGVAVAHADQDRVEALSEAAGLGVPGVVDADSATTHSRQGFVGGTLVVTAESTVVGLDIGGGQLHVDHLRSLATAHVDGGSVTTASATTTITGATAGGVSVTIDSTGIHVAGNGDNGALQSQVNGALANLASQGISVRLLTPTKQAAEGSAAAATGGLLITFSKAVNAPLPAPPPLPPSLPGLPTANGTWAGSVTVGGAGIEAFASPLESFPLPPVDLGTGVPPAVSAPTQGISAPVLGRTQPPTAGTTGTGGPVVASRPTPAAVLGVDLTNKRLRTLALVLLGYPALVLVGSPLRRSRKLRNTR